MSAHVDVSVIVAVRNGGASLRSCLDSITGQRGCRVELIVVDALSDDDTPAIVREFGATIAHHIRESDRGISDAWNKGVRRASGRWCAFLGADDRFVDRGVLRRLVERGDARDGIVLVYGDLRIVGGPYDYILSVDQTTARDRIRKGSMIPHPGAVHRTSALRAAGGFATELRIAGDLDLVTRLAERGDLERLPEVIVEMRVGGVSTRPSMQMRRHRERFIILRSRRSRSAAAAIVLLGATLGTLGHVSEVALIRSLGVERGRRAANRLRTLVGLRPR